MSKSDSYPRSTIGAVMPKMITIRLSDEEHKCVAFQAEAVGKSMNAYIRCLLGIPTIVKGNIRGRKSKVLRTSQGIKVLKNESSSSS